MSTHQPGRLAQCLRSANTLFLHALTCSYMLSSHHLAGIVTAAVFADAARTSIVEEIVLLKTRSTARRRPRRRLTLYRVSALLYSHLCYLEPYSCV